MVNENFDPESSSLPLRPFGFGRRARRNPAAKLLRRGDIVKPNYRNARIRHEHPPGVILDINGREAQVRWQDRLTAAPVTYPLKLLIKIEDQSAI